MPIVKSVVILNEEKQYRNSFKKLLRIGSLKFKWRLKTRSWDLWIYIPKSWNDIGIAFCIDWSCNQTHIKLNILGFGLMLWQHPGYKCYNVKTKQTEYVQ